ncbi:MAG TPA: FAD/NAD(P)-binding protein [Actinospica sp.]|nr:FAD/NAD(P)-binding protein [Actinospica sp.]
MVDDGTVTTVCIIGAGPRGLSVLERLCANERARPGARRLVVHVVDPGRPGAGGVWRVDQSRHLLMNTVSSQVTVFTDASARIEGPIEPGPSLYDWAAEMTLLGGFEGYEDWVVEEVKKLGPDTYPTRALYGRYLIYCFHRIVARAPRHMTVHVHRSQAVAMSDVHGVSNGHQGVRLENGTRLNELDSIVMAQGHVGARLTPRQERTAALARIHFLTYITPSNPADVNLDVIEPGETVLVRGLGLNFFDYMALLTLGRGGRFIAEGERLRYRPSGAEPVLYASSRRGVPYHARGENQKGAFGRYTPRLLTTPYISGLRERALGGGDRLNFATDLWPLLCREVESVYYETLLRSQGRDEDAERLAEAILNSPASTETADVARGFGLEDGALWDWKRLMDPCRGRQFADRDEFRRWILGYLEQDVRHAEAGNLEGPVKAALDVLRDMRNEVRLAVDHGGLDGGSHRDDLEGWYTPLNAFLSIGPPVSRIREMIALIEAGVLELTGPGTQIRFDAANPSFVGESRAVPGPPIRANALIEARLPEPDLRRTADPLLLHLMNTEQAAPFRIPSESGDEHVTGGLAVSERPYHLLDAAGRAHPRRFAFGVPTEAVHWATAAGIRPGVDSVTLGDSDAIARAMLALPTASTPPGNVAGPTDETDLKELIV